MPPKQPPAAAAPAPPPPPKPGAVRVIHVDTRPITEGLEGAMRTWRPAPSQPEMHHAFVTTNSVPPPKRSYLALAALNNAWHCRAKGWAYEVAHVPAPADRHPSWIKIRHVLFCWDRYDADDVIVVMDTDAWIRDADGFAHAIETQLTGDTVFLAAGEPQCHETVTTASDVMNGGFMCFRKDPRVRAFLQTAWDMPDARPDVAHLKRDWPWEQGCLSRAYRADPAVAGWMAVAPVPTFNTPAGTMVTHCWYKDLAYDLALDDLLSTLGQALIAHKRRTTEFVVARHEEDVSWIGEWLPFVERVTIYDKSPTPMTSPHPKVRVVPLDNVGRESHTYAYHFAEHYDDLCDAVVCTQGRYEDHLDARAFAALVRTGERDAHGRLDVAWSQHLMRHFGWTEDRNWNGSTQRMAPYGGTMAKFYLAHVGDDLVPEDQVRWWAGAIFRTSADAVRAKPRKTYEALRDVLGVGLNPEAGHIMERFWNRLLNP